MKVNLPVNMTPPPAGLPDKLTGQSSDETISPFSIHMNKILNPQVENNHVRERETNKESVRSESEEAPLEKNQNPVDSTGAVTEAQIQTESIDEETFLKSTQGSGGSNSFRVNFSGSDISSREIPRDNYFVKDRETGIIGKFKTEAKLVTSASEKEVLFFSSKGTPRDNYFVEDREAGIVGKFNTEATPVTSASEKEVLFFSSRGTPRDNYFVEDREAGIVGKLNTEAKPVTSASENERLFFSSGETHGDLRLSSGESPMDSRPIIDKPNNSELDSDSGIIGEDPPLSGDEARIAKEIQSDPKTGIKIANTPHASISMENRESLKLNTGQTNPSLHEFHSGKSIRTETDSAANGRALAGDHSPQRAPGLKDDHFQMNETNTDRIVSRAASSESMASGSDGSETNKHADELQTARIIPGNGNIANSITISVSNPGKAAQPEIPIFASTGASGVAASNESMASNTGKPIAAQSGGFLAQVAERIQFLIRDGGGVIRIQLQPDEFGRLEIRAESTSKGLVARIAAESNSVKSILENNLHALQQNLQDQGLKVESIQVMLQDGSNSQTPSGFFSKSGHSNSGNNEKGPHRNFNASVNSAEEMAGENDANVHRPNSRFHTVA